MTEDLWLIQKPSRLDKALRERYPVFTKKMLKIWFQEKPILVNGKPAKAGQHLFEGDQIKIFGGEFLQNPYPPAPHIPIQVVYQDEHLIIVDKPHNLPTHPLYPWETESASQAVLAQFPQLKGIGEQRSPGLLHRLDTSTSGLLAFAKTQASYDLLKDAHKSGLWEKTYHALVLGELKGSQEICFPIIHDPKNDKKMKIFEPLTQEAEYADLEFQDQEVLHTTPQKSSTQIKAVRNLEEKTFVEVVIMKGTRHQIRVHLHQIGHSVVGDQLYGGS